MPYFTSPFFSFPPSFQSLSYCCKYCTRKMCLQYWDPHAEQFLHSLSSFQCCPWLAHAHERSDCHFEHELPFCLSLFCSMMQDILENVVVGTRCGGITINNLPFSDDIDLIAGNVEELKEITVKLDDTSRKYVLS